MTEARPGRAGWRAAGALGGVLGGALAGAVTAAVALLLLAVPSTPALAYDAGYHLDLTREALLAEGFGGDAVKSAETGNFLSDGFSSAEQVLADRWVRLLGFDDDWGALFGPAEMRRASNDHLHFGGLGDTAAVAREWDGLVQGTYRAAREAEARSDAAGLVTVLGTSLHAVQDFYAHSNWATLDWGGDATWLDVPAAERDSAKVYSSGEAATAAGAGLGKDYAGLPAFEVSYREAYYASRQWVGLVRTWVGPGFWDQAAGLVAPEAAVEREFVRCLAWYGGHWKGPSSESYVNLAVVGALYLKRADRAGIERWKTYCPLLTGDPVPGAAPAPVVVEHPAAQRWLEVRVLRARETDPDFFFDIDPIGQADFYLRVKVGAGSAFEREYVEAMIRDRDDVSPFSWLTLVPLPPGTEDISISLALWDEDEVGGGLLPTLGGSDDLCDIAPERGSRIWSTRLAVSSLAPTANLEPTSPGPVGGEVARPGLTVHTNGMRPGATLAERRGDGKEAALDFTLTVVAPPRR